MDIFFPYTFRERAIFKEAAVKCGFVELTAETSANVGILPADERISILLMAWKNIGQFIKKNAYNHDVEIIVSWICRCTLNLWFGREWIACAIESKTELIEQMMKVYPTAFINVHPYSWPYMFSIYRDPWMVEYLNINFQRMSGPDLTPILEPKDAEFFQQEGMPLLILRMVNMFDFRMVKLVKYMCLRLLLTWEDEDSTASKTLRSSPNADEYIDYARHIYMLSICEINGFKDLHYTLETIQRCVHCELTDIRPQDLGAQAIAKGLKKSNKTLTELLIAFLLKVPKTQFENLFGAVLTKYICFIAEYQLRNVNRISSTNLPWSLEEVYSKLVEIFINQRESSEDQLRMSSNLEQIFLGLKNLKASKCAYELIKQRSHSKWHTSKVTLLFTIICQEINVIQNYKYNDVQSTDELIEKEKDLALYYRDLAKLFHKNPYLEQEAWLTTFSLHPCREFMDSVTKCGARNLRAIKKQAHKIKGMEPKTKIKETVTLHENILQCTSDINESTLISNTIRRNECIEPSETAVLAQPTACEINSNGKNFSRKKTDQDGFKKFEHEFAENFKDTLGKTVSYENNQNMKMDFKHLNLQNSVLKNLKPKSSSMKKVNFGRHHEKTDLAEEIFAAAAGAAENINSQTAETIKYPVFALINSVTDTNDLMKFTNYNDSYEQYGELNKILAGTKFNHASEDDILTILISPRYKRLTWAISWKKLKKRCKIILTKDNKKRELVEQSMADANDRLTHLNIDYEKYKNKPQIDYGTIEGGYECYDTDSDINDAKTDEVDSKTIKEISSSNKKNANNSENLILNVNINEKNLKRDYKPILKVENLDSSYTNFLKSIESKHLSKPVYLNKPVYLVRNVQTFSSVLSEDQMHSPTANASQLNDCCEEQEIFTCQNASNNVHTRSQLQTEMTFNNSTSIKQQFKFETANDLNGIKKSCNQKDNHDSINNSYSYSNVVNQYNTNPVQGKSVPVTSSRLSPKLFEDVPEDLTMFKFSNNNFCEISSSCQTLPLNLTSKNDFEIQIANPNINLQNQIIESIENSDKIPKNKSITKFNSKKNIRNNCSESSKETAFQANTHFSCNQESLKMEPSDSFKSVKTLTQTKSTITNTNPTSAVIFSAAAASYHRTPFLNAKQEPNILQHLLTKDIAPLNNASNNVFLDENTAIKNSVMKMNVEPETLTNLNHEQNSNTTEPIKKQSSGNSNLYDRKEKVVKQETLTSHTENDLLSANEGRMSKHSNFFKDSNIGLQIYRSCSTNAIEDNYSRNNLTFFEKVSKKIPKQNPNLAKPLHHEENYGEFSSSASFSEFEFKVPAAVPKPCFFMQSKRKNVTPRVSDWVKNIMFNDKTAVIVVPSTKKANQFLTDQQKKCINESSSLLSENHTENVLFDKHVLFNKKLLDPHLKTYKYSKATNKTSDIKELESDVYKNRIISETLDSANQCMENRHLKYNIDTCISHNMQEDQTSYIGLELDPTRPSTSLNSFQSQKNNQDLKKTDKPSKVKKKCDKKNFVSKKKFDQMFGWLNTVISTNRQPTPECVDASDTLLSLFSAQLINQAKSIHFNHEYVQEREKFIQRINENGIDCEASMLIASPGPTSDGVKLIKAFKKNIIYKGVDLCSNEVSFTSSLAKEILGTVIKVTLNKSDQHINCTKNHFDASDALDEFKASRHNANSPTFYSPTLSTKHCNNGTLADSVEYVDTSLEELIPKPGRKRISEKKFPQLKKKTKLRTSFKNLKSGCCQDYSGQQIQLSQKDRASEKLIHNENELNINNQVTKCSDPFTEVESSFDLIPREFYLSDKTILNNEVLGSVKNNYVLQSLSTQKESFETDYSENQVFNNLNFLKSEKETEIEEVKSNKMFSNKNILESVKETNIMDDFLTERKSLLLEERADRGKPISKNLTYLEETEFNPTKSYKTLSNKEMIGSDKESKILNNLTKQKKSSEEYCEEKGKGFLEETGFYEIENHKTSLNNDFLMSENLCEKKLIPTSPSFLNNQTEQQIYKEGSKGFTHNSNDIEKLQNIITPTRNKIVQIKIQSKDEKIKNKIQTVNDEMKADTIIKEVLISKKLNKPASIDKSHVEHELISPKKSKQFEEQFKEKLSVIEDSSNIIVKEKEKLKTNVVSLQDLGSDKKVEKNNSFKEEKTDEKEHSQTNNFDHVNDVIFQEISQCSILVNKPIDSSEKKNSNEENQQLLEKKRVVKRRISYAELDSDSDVKLKTLMKKSSLKTNFSSIRKSKRKSLNKKNVKKNVLKKSSTKKRLKKTNISKENIKRMNLKQYKQNISLNKNNSNISDDDLSNKTKPNNEIISNDSDDDIPLKINTGNCIKSKKNYFNNSVQKKYKSACSPKKSTIIKFSRRKTSSLNYFALFLSDSDEDEPVKPIRRTSPDRPWTYRTKRKKNSKESSKRKQTNLKNLRRNRTTIKKKQHRNRNNLRKRNDKSSIGKMPILKREDSEHTEEENIYECATISTANETDEDFTSDHHYKKYRQKIVKPMKIRCVSRRVINSEIKSESRSCSPFPKENRFLRTNSLGNNLMSKLLQKSNFNSCSTIKIDKQSTAELTCKSFAKEKNNINDSIKYDSKNEFTSCSNRKMKPLTLMEKEAINNFNCVNLQVRLQRLTANEAILCRKPYIRLDKKFVENYFAQKGF